MKLSIDNPENKIIYLEGIVNYTNIYFEEGRPHLSSYTLLRHQEHLGNFVRISRKHLVNPLFIKHKNLDLALPYIVLHNGEKLKVSRRRVGVV